jgi:hypothetical protein
MGSDDPRADMGSGTSKLAVSNRTAARTEPAGVVTGIRITADGPLLRVGGRDVPLASVMEVQAPAL